jgi:hypothetical protein
MLCKDETQILTSFSMQGELKTKQGKKKKNLIFLIPKGQRSFFSKKHLKSAISSSRSPNPKKNYFFAHLTVRSFPRLLGEHVQKVLKQLIARIVRLQCLNWKEKFLSLVPGRDNRL